MQQIANNAYEYTTPYLVLGAIYLVIVVIITMVIKKVEKKLSVSDRSK